MISFITNFILGSSASKDYWTVSSWRCHLSLHTFLIATHNEQDNIGYKYFYSDTQRTRQCRLHTCFYSDSQGTRQYRLHIHIYIAKHYEQDNIGYNDKKRTRQYRLYTHIPTATYKEPDNKNYKHSYCDTQDNQTIIICTYT